MAASRVMVIAKATFVRPPVCSGVTKAGGCCTTAGCSTFTGATGRKEVGTAGWRIVSFAVTGTDGLMAPSRFVSSIARRMNFFESTGVEVPTLYIAYLSFQSNKISVSVKVTIVSCELIDHN